MPCKLEGGNHASQENAGMGNRTLAGRTGDAEDVVEARDDITDIAKRTTPLENPDL